MHYIYALQCDNKNLYIGYSADLKTRVKRHLSGKVKSTKSKMPLKLVYYEAYLSKSDAARREKQLKEHKAKSDLKKQINNSLSEKIIKSA